MRRALGNTGAGGFLSDDVLLVFAAVAAPDASLQASLTDATAPPNQLPTDLLVPLKLWERPFNSGAGGSSDDFVEMVDLTRHGGLPSRVQDTTLSVWEWRAADGLRDEIFQRVGRAIIPLCANSKPRAAVHFLPAVATHRFSCAAFSM